MGLQKTLRTRVSHFIDSVPLVYLSQTSKAKVRLRACRERVPNEIQRSTDIHRDLSPRGFLRSYIPVAPT